MRYLSDRVYTNTPQNNIIINSGRYRAESPHLYATRTNGSSLNELACLSRKLSYFNVNYRYTSRARTKSKIIGSEKCVRDIWNISRKLER